LALSLFISTVEEHYPKEKENNILLKAMWGRGPEVGKHDWEDVQAMMAHLPALD